MTTIIARTIRRRKIFGRAVKLRISFRDPECHFLVLELPNGTSFSTPLKGLLDAVERAKAVRRVIELLADASSEAQTEATELKAKWNITAKDIEAAKD